MVQSAPEIVTEFLSRGVCLEACDNCLRFHPHATLTLEEMVLLRRPKTDIIAHLTVPNPASETETPSIPDEKVGFGNGDTAEPWENDPEDVD